jgi:hypothetical protein
MNLTQYVVWTILITVALVAAWIYRGTNMKAPVPIITLALVIGVGYGVFSYNREQTANKAHDDCIARVERSIGNRAMWVALGDYLVDHGNPDSATVLRELVDKNLPPLDAKDCPA